MEPIDQRLDHLFSYHPPDPEDIPRFAAIREAARAYAAVLLQNTPSSADQAAALRAIRESVAWANASIALGGKS